MVEGLEGEGQVTIGGVKETFHDRDLVQQLSHIRNHIHNIKKVSATRRGRRMNDCYSRGTTFSETL